MKREDFSTALVVTPHPMTVQGQRIYDTQAAALLAGETLASFLARHGVVPDQQWVVCIGGVDVPQDQWARVKPKHGHLIEARRVPERAVLRLVAMVALTVFAPGWGSALGKALGIGQAWGTAIVSLAGSMVINKLLGPKALDASRVQNSVSPTYSIGAGRNTARPFEPFGLVLGNPYCVPDLAAQPYTYFANGEQYLWQILHCGINCEAVENIRVGQTSIDAYQGLTLSYEGFASGNTGLPVLGTSVDTVAGALLDAPTGTGALVTRTSSLNTLQLAVDIEGSLYSVNQSSGAYENLYCEISIEYRLVGSGTWLPFVGASATVALNNASTKPLRLTYQKAVTAGQYELQLRKLTVNATASNQQNTIQWSSLKSYQQDNGNYKGQSRLGIQVLASGQLNGGLDEVNLMALAKPHPYWNGSAWVSATSRANGLSNPGALLLLLARGIYDIDGRLLAGLGYDDAQIDIERLKLFMVWCTAKGFTFDYLLQELMSIGELMDAIAAAGMGAISWHPGTFSVIWFADTDPVESVLNMGTMKAKSFSVDYATQATADEIEFSFFDRDRNNTWKAVRVLAPGVTTPTNTGRQKLLGVTQAAHAAVLARFTMGQNVFQRKTVNCEVDLEHLTFRRGTVMALSHDLTQWGYGGRVKAAANAAGIVTLTLDDLVPAVSPTGVTTRYIGLRLAGESQYRVFGIDAFAGESRTVTLSSSWPGGVPVPGDSAANPAHDAIWIYDFKATPGQKMRVASISPVGNLDGATLELVTESPEFWDYVWNGAYTPPPSGSLLQGAPVVTSAVVTEQLKRQGNTYYTELTLTFAMTGRYSHAELWGVAGTGVKVRLASTTSQRLTWQGGLAEVWTLELRAFSDIHAATPYPLSYTVTGLAQPPAPFDVFTVMAQPDGTRQFNFSYSALDRQPADWLGAEIRYVSGTDPSPDWDTMTPLQDTTTYYTHSPVELNAPLAGTYTFACKSLDTTGNESSYLVRSLALPDRRRGNVFDEFFEQPEGWAGVKTGCHMQDGVLEANDTTTWATTPATWAAWTRWNMTPTSPIYYETPGRDLGVVVSGQISTVVDADGTVVQELATSANGSSWSGWSPATGNFTAQWIKLRLTVTATGPAPVPVVRQFDWQVVAPLKSEYINDQVISGYTGSYRIGTGDVRIPLSGSYSVLKRIQVVIQDSSAGAWSWQRIDQTLTYGPRIQFKLNGTLADPAFVDFFIEGF